MENMIDLSIIILAAGKGSRMKSVLPKVMHPLAGRPMIGWLLECAEALEPAQIIVVAGPDMKELEEVCVSHTVAIQQQQNGTADAVKAALPLLKNETGNVLILLGDEPFVSIETLLGMINAPVPTIMAFRAEDPSGFGRLIQRADHTLQEIVEDKDANEQQRLITLCNAGNFCLPLKRLQDWLPKITNENAQGEYYLTDLPKIAAQDHVFFEIVEVEADHGWGINDRMQLAAHEAFVQNALRGAALEAGVTLIDPYTTYFSWDTEIGRDVTIEPNVFFGPGVKVGDGTTIKMSTRIEGAHIGKNCEIGPFAHINYPKKPSIIGDDVVIGNFVEVKRSVLKDGVKAKHHAYIADAEIGKKSNIACGAITVNYDGYQKHKTIIGENVMVGSNVSLIAPITVGDGAFIAAGSTISDNIPDNALAIERTKPELREGWASAYRNRKKKV